MVDLTPLFPIRSAPCAAPARLDTRTTIRSRRRCKALTSRDGPQSGSNGNCTSRGIVTYHGSQSEEATTTRKGFSEMATQRGRTLILGPDRNHWTTHVAQNDQHIPSRTTRTRDGAMGCRTEVQSKCAAHLLHPGRQRRSRRVGLAGSTLARLCQRSDFVSRA